MSFSSCSLTAFNCKNISIPFQNVIVENVTNYYCKIPSLDFIEKYKISLHKFFLTGHTRDWLPKPNQVLKNLIREFQATV